MSNALRGKKEKNHEKCKEYVRSCGRRAVTIEKHSYSKHGLSDKM
jgi:hypothetical protein